MCDVRTARTGDGAERVRQTLILVLISMGIAAIIEPPPIMNVIRKLSRKSVTSSDAKSRT